LRCSSFDRIPKKKHGEAKNIGCIGAPKNNCYGKEALPLEIERIYIKICVAENELEGG